MTLSIYFRGLFREHIHKRYRKSIWISLAYHNTTTMSTNKSDDRTILAVLSTNIIIYNIILKGYKFYH